jgi:ribosome recycling factor
VAACLISPTAAQSRNAEGPSDTPQADLQIALLLPQRITVEKTPPPDLTPKQRRELMKSNFKKMKAEAAELASMATELRDELDKTSIDVLSLDVIHRAERIEKLARKIKEEAKGY